MNLNIGIYSYMMSHQKISSSADAQRFGANSSYRSETDRPHASIAVC